MLKQQYSKGANAYKKNSVTTTDQRTLILMLYDGAIRRLKAAIQMELDTKGLHLFHTYVVRAKSIVTELLASLNLEAGGDIAKNLQRIYIYIFNELIDANLSKDKRRLVQVVGLLESLREGWQNIKPENRASTPNKAAPMQSHPGPQGSKLSLKQ